MAEKDNTTEKRENETTEAIKETVEWLVKKPEKKPDEDAPFAIPEIKPEDIPNPTEQSKP